MKSDLKIAFILGIGIAVSIIVINYLFSSLDSELLSSNENIDSLISLDKSNLKKAPDLVGISHYLNTTPEKLKEDIKGKVVLYDIWTYSCINCIRTIPYITAWDEKYSDKGLLIIGIHSPEFEFEKNKENVELAVEKYGIKYPVVMDNDWKTWKAFENRYWPRKYLADHEGYIRYDHIGEGNYQETEKIIQQLLEERSQSLGMKVAVVEPLVNLKEFNYTSFRTPELYFGYKFMQGRNQLGSSEGFNPDKITNFKEPGKLDLHKFYPVGDWISLEDGMKLESNSGSIKLLYHAKEVNIVSSNSAQLEILLDGKPIEKNTAGIDVNIDNKIMVSEPRLYNIISSSDSGTHELEVRVNQKGFMIYTFTFG